MPQPSTLIDHIAAEFGADVLNETSIKQISEHAPDRVRLHETVWRWRKAASLPPVLRECIRPLIEHVHGPDISGVWETNTLPGRWSWSGGHTSELLSLVKYHLLYCDSVVLRDPFSLAAPDHDHLRRLRGPVREQFSRILERGTASDLRSLAVLASLIRAGVVLLAPRRYRLGANYLHAQDLLETASVSNYVARLDPLSSDEIAQARYDALLDEDSQTGLARRLAEKQTSHLWAALARLLDGLAGLQEADQRGDLYLASRASVVALEMLVDSPDIARLAGVRAGGSKLLPRLLTLYVPGFGNRLNVEDIIAIRSDSTFAQWRLTLERALREVGEAGHDVLQSYAPSVRDLDEQLSMATNEMRQRVAKSSALSKLKSAPVDMTIATGAASAGVLVAGSAVATIGTTTTALAAKLVVDWWRGRAKEGDQLLLRHAAIFETH